MVSKVKREPDVFVFLAINSFHEKGNRKIGKLAQSDACADNNSVHNFRRSAGARRKVCRGTNYYLHATVNLAERLQKYNRLRKLTELNAV